MAQTDHTLSTLIAAARDASASTTRRHQAFEELVRRFRDLAYACALARLRDPVLAEDAAQDAFLTAWERLEQLRDPNAFAGWIRRLVATQCSRRLRGKRLELRAEDEARDVAAPSDQAADAEAAAMGSFVASLLGQMTPADRLVLILFYGSERSQADIASWLAVPVTTVARRLAHAKRRMRRRVLAAWSGDLRKKRQLGGNAFIVELSARIRRAQPHDAENIADLATELGFDRLARTPPDALPHGYLVDDASGRPSAYAATVQTMYKPIYDLRLAMGADALKRHTGDVLLTQILQDVTASDAIVLQHRTSARHSGVVNF